MRGDLFRVAVIIILVTFLHHTAAQNIVTMPHQGVDTLHLAGGQCVTILDPGGEGPYENNEDSYLYVISDTWFYLQIDYMLGLQSDGMDWIKIYNDTVMSRAHVKDSLTGNGSKSYTSGQYRTLIHFHSNSYSSYDGFRIRIQYNNTIYNWTSTPMTTSSVALQWDDTKESSSGWTVCYWWDADSVQRYQTPTKSATISGMRNDTWYAYYIYNNDYICQKLPIKNMCAQTDTSTTVLMASAGITTHDTLDDVRCRSLQGPSGNGSINLYFPTTSAYYILNKGHGVYLEGQNSCTTNVNVGTYTSFYNLQPNGSTRQTDVYNNGLLNRYFPEGWVHVRYNNYSRGNYVVRYENGSLVKPDTSGVSASGATISWTDNTGATQWRFRYRSSEEEWQELTTPTPSVTLTGLEAATQYVYSIEGLGDVPGCLVPEPHAFITAGMPDDTIVMPFRGRGDTVRLTAGRCYTLLDAGGNKRHFDNDYSKLVLEAPAGTQMVIDGKCRLASSDVLYINSNTQSKTYQNFDMVDLTATGNRVTIAFESDNSLSSNGFVLHIRLTDTLHTIDSLRATEISQTTAKISWNDTVATAWTLYYGHSESAMDSLTTTQRQVVLTGLLPATQYLYHVVSNLEGGGCVAPSNHLRQAFITQGMDSSMRLMPYRGTDSVELSPGQCLCIYDAGGPTHNYFDDDSSSLFVYSDQYFYFDGVWTISPQQTGDADDLLRNRSQQWDYSYNGQRRMNSYCGSTTINHHTKRYMDFKFESDHRDNNPGFRLDVVWNTISVGSISFSNITETTARISWTQGVSTPQTIIWYGPSGSPLTPIAATTNPFTLNGLQPNTQYDIRIGGDSVICHASLLYNFTTAQAVGPGDIVMPTHGADTLTIQHGDCYTILDPGGYSNYFPSDTSVIVIQTATGEGLYYNIQWNVDDELYITDDNGYEYRMQEKSYNRQRWVPGGKVRVRLQSNEAIQTSGLVMTLMTASSAFGPNYQNMTDSTVTITWQDTSSATAWQFRYGPTIDSMTTDTTTTKQYHLTGLRRNKQYYYRIYSIDEDLTSGCYLDNTFGIIMPCDSGLLIEPYISSGAKTCQHLPLYYSPTTVISAKDCHHVLDDGSTDRMFQKGDNTYNIIVPDAQSVTVNGYYELGTSRFYVHTSPSNKGSYYSGTGYMEKNVGNSFYITTNYGGGEDDYGFDLALQYNYQATNVAIVWDSASTAAVTWVDTASSQWIVTYGPGEKHLDTLFTSQPNAVLTGLRPNQQYVVYIVGTTPFAQSCKKHLPTKTVFSTITDSSLIAMSYQTAQIYTLDPNICYTVTDNSPEYGYFYDDDDGNYYKRLTLVAPPGVLLSVRGWFRLATGDYLHIYYHDANNTLQDLYAPNDGYITLSNMKDFAIGRRINADTTIADGFELHVSYSTITGFETSLETDTTCRLTWNDVSNATQWNVHYGTSLDDMDTLVTDRPMAHLRGLEYGEHYTVFITSNASSLNCMDTAWYEFCSGNRECLDYTDLASCFASTYYGTYTNPRIWSGFIDYGPDSIDSRHTVITDTAATDPRTGGQLKCVPTHLGQTNSVRLGNWNIGAEAESIQYSYRVDTTQSEAMLLRYAVVLENPGHIAANQPRFQFKISDEYGNPINQLCYSADFVSSDDLGWNSYHYDTNYVLWKDWTPVGLNLEQLHGQRINVNLTTYDCRESGHFGYAYFTLECGDKDIIATNCGAVSENTFLAPEGFNYQWFNVDSTDVILGTGRSFTSSQNGTYKCRAYFPGAGEGSNCYFEKTVVVGDAYPYANFDYTIADTNGCQVAVQFYNRSVVTSDSLHTQPTAMECGSRHWDFGDGTESDKKHPLHYYEPGWYDVTLRAAMGDGDNSCSHDTTIRILIPSPCVVYDSIDTALCQGDTLWVRQTPLTTTCDTIIRDDYRPDSIMATMVSLTVHPVLDTTINGGLCDGDSYTLFGFNESVPGSYSHHFQSIYGCDSIYHLNLDFASRYDTTIVVRACSNEGYHYRDTTLMVTTDYVDSLLSAYQCDSVVTVRLTIDPSYQIATADTICRGDTLLFYGERLFDILTVDHLDSTLAGCDSNEHLELWVNPRYSTYDTVHLCRYETYSYGGQTYHATHDIVDSLMTTRSCDSVVHIALRLHDSTFRAAAHISNDSLFWLQGDTLFAGCSPMKLWLSDSSVAATAITWYFGDGESSDLRQTTHTYPDSGVYSIVMIAQSTAGCLDTMTMRAAVQVFQRQKADFSWTPEMPSMTDAHIQLLNLTEPPDSLSPYTWYFYAPDADTLSDPTDSVAAYQTDWRWDSDRLSSNYEEYVVLGSWRSYATLRGDSVVCYDTARHLVIIANIFLQFPNAVTPNGDGVNDVWRVVNLAELGYYPVNRIRIYDRWGRMVYLRDNVRSTDEVWDPNDCNCPDGTYFFRFDAQGPYGRVQHNGAIEVMR